MRNEINYREENESWDSNILTAPGNKTIRNKQIKAKGGFSISFLLILTHCGQIEKYEGYTFQVASMTCANTRRYRGEGEGGGPLNEKRVWKERHQKNAEEMNKCI